MDSCSRRIAFYSYERVVFRDIDLDDFPVILCDFRDNSCIDSAISSFESDIFDDCPFERRVSCAFTVSDQRCVERRDSMQPCGDGIDVDLVEVVVSVPFQLLRGMPSSLWNAFTSLGQIRQDCAWVGNPSCLKSDLDWILNSAESFLFFANGTESIDIRTGDILEMASGDDAVESASLPSGVHHLAACSSI